ncbi:MAG: hypothetical protein GYA24_18235 [Candidatus Lokiarchaeota archaeon]|nr:hypothetical protein [Candidatus Lokiarchaeota archaeon]
MLCERAMQILEAMQGKQDIPVSDAELDELIQMNCIQLFTSERTAESVADDIAATRTQYNAVADEIRQVNKDMLAAEREQSTGSMGLRIGAALRFGAGNAIRQRVVQLKHVLEAKEQEIGRVKKTLLDLSVEKETVERAVRIDGHRALITPVGERLTGEIRARARHAMSDLSVVMSKIARLDNAFSTAMSRIDAMMRTSTFPSVWAPYFLVLGITGQEIENFQAALLSNYSYNGDLDTQLLDYSTTRMLRGVHGSGASYTGAPNLAEVARDVFSQISNMVASRAPKAPVYARQVIGIIAKMLAGWSPAMLQHVSIPSNDASAGAVAPGAPVEHLVTNVNEYLDNLYKMLSGLPTASMVDGVPLALGLAGPRDASTAVDPADEQDEVLAVLLLSLSKQPKKYETFLETFKSVTHGRKLFAAIAAMFPWDAAETWAVLLRAESCIQREQSAKFVPELIEYAILLSLNPEIVVIEDNIPEQQLAAWKYLAIPAIQAAVIGGLEPRIESYIQARPMSYVMYPRYYRHHHIHHTSLHYHTTG